MDAAWKKAHRMLKKMAAEHVSLCSGLPPLSANDTHEHINPAFRDYYAGAAHFSRQTTQSDEGRIPGFAVGHPVGQV